MVAGLMATGSAAHTTARTSAPKTTEARLAAASSPTDAGNSDAQAVGLVPAAPEPPRKLRAMTAPANGAPLFGGTVPLQDIALPGGNGAFGIPEIVLAAYRNAELTLQSSEPNCGLSWSLLAGIGRIESNHAGHGRTDAAGTTIGTIYGPALDGTLPGNEVIKAADGNFVRAVGPMQFLPGTWSLYASDGNGDGVADPNNVFDASLAAGKYLCSGGLNLRDPQQELRAVLRYNNSTAYAANVLSWANAYKTGGAPTQVQISPELIPPGTMQAPPAGPDILAANGTIPTTTEPPSQATTTAPTPQQPTQVMINIPGLPPIPCGIFCPPPKPNPCDPAAVPAPMPPPGVPGQPAAPAEAQRWSAGDPVRPVDPPAADAKPADPNANPNAPANSNAAPADPNAKPAPACAPPQGQAAPGAPAQPPAPGRPDDSPAPEQAQMPSKTPEPGPEAAAPAPAAPPPPTQAPGITLPFGIVIPLPAPPAPPR
ncbi:lytic transglycosylase domain-containing protein [Nocardia veterana]|uniref:lytic transglycosylase domain-containing protein n=2 Tax=Nocardia veterana TaxID=132249 RepID=UPI0028A23F1D|nr:lytic murein transglycosylase [Nocardia veterana]